MYDNLVIMLKMYDRNKFYVYVYDHVKNVTASSIILIRSLDQLTGEDTNFNGALFGIALYTSILNFVILRPTARLTSNLTHSIQIMQVCDH